MNKYLHSTKIFYDKLRSQLGHTNSYVLHIIIGNVSCDLDSCVSAIALAWAKSKTQPKNNSILYLPMMNIKREKFRLRTEITHLFKELKIDSKDIVFRDEVDLKLLSQKMKDRFRLTLVDHHVLASAEEYLEPHVVEIIDHRQKVRDIRPSIHTNIALVGSCATLVGEILLESVDENVILSEIETMLIDAILIDTSFLCASSGRSTTRDTKIIEKLRKERTDDELRRLFSTTNDAKFSVDGLTTKDMLLKDPKLLECGSKTVLFSTLHQPMSLFLRRPDVYGTISVYHKAKKLLAWIGLFPVHKEPCTDHFKPIVIYCTDETIRREITEELIAITELNIGINEECAPFEGLVFLRMYNIQKTRKHVLPVVDHFLHEMEQT